MDPDDIIRMVEEIKIQTDDYEPKLTLNDEEVQVGVHRARLCLAAKVLSTKSINRETFRHHMPRILQSTRSVEIEAMGDNMFMMEFKASADRRRALHEGPWHFFRDLVVIKEINGLENIRALIFEEISIWVQYHNLPVAFMNQPILEQIGNQIGITEAIDAGETGTFLGRYARVRVRINITKPLQKYVRVGMKDGAEDFIIIMTYEKLPNFCYACGKIGHRLRDCDQDGTDNNKPPFGPWLRATTQSGKKKERTPSPSKSCSTTGEHGKGMKIILHDSENAIQMESNNSPIHGEGNTKFRQNQSATADVHDNMTHDNVRTEIRKDGRLELPPHLPRITMQKVTEKIEAQTALPRWNKDDHMEKGTDTTQLPKSPMQWKRRARNAKKGNLEDKQVPTLCSGLKRGREVDIDMEDTLSPHKRNMIQRLSSSTSPSSAAAAMQPRRQQ